MTESIIQVQGLSKRYHLGVERHETLRDRVTAAFRKRINAFRGVEQRDPGEFWALRDVSFEVPRGEVLGIIGRNGAGKSTLLKILSRITEPTSGRAVLRGRVASLLEVGTGFHPDLTGRDNIFLNGAILGMSRAEIRRRFDEIVAFADVHKFIDTPVKHYSSGMYVRLAFGVAAHLDPEILIIDEVLAVGDAAFQRKCLGKIDAIAKGGRTVIFVSHHMAAVQTLCHSALLLRDGTVYRHGSVPECVTDYLKSGIVAAGERAVADIPQGFESELRFMRVAVLDAHEKPTPTVNLSDGVRIQIEYALSRGIRGAQVGFELWNEVGTCVFCSSDFDMDPAEVLAEKAPGHYRASCHLPADLLRAGTYQVTLCSSIPNVRSLAELENAIAFQVIDDGSIVLKLGQGRRGVILPILKWARESV